MFDQIDWGSHEGIILVDGGAQVGFQELLLVQDAFAAPGSAVLKFVNVRAGSVLMSKVLLAARTCNADALQLKKSFEEGDPALSLEENAVLDGNTLKMRSMEMSLGVVDDIGEDLTFDETCPTSFSSTYFPESADLDNLESVQSASDASNISSAQAVLFGSLLIFLGVGLVVSLVIVLVKWRAFSSRRQPSNSSTGTETATVVVSTQRGSDFPLEESSTLHRPPERGDSEDQIDPKGVFRGERIRRCGNVYKGFYLGQLVAIKVVEHRPELLTEDGQLREAVIGKSATHPHVVETFAFWTLPVEIPGALGITESFSSQGREPRSQAQGLETSIAMEYCDERTLDRAILEGVFVSESSGRPPDMKRILMTLTDVAEAFNFLHSKHIVHCDLKAQNIFLARSESDSRGFIAKVIALRSTSGNLEHISVRRKDPR
ncbi:hypothetical protein BSKO_13974 [Bryopsis sp. KO-2023]|nr:hypothetical protein BSKO_13974 [Bryopsis sp. KO-2023]